LGHGIARIEGRFAGKGVGVLSSMQQRKVIQLTVRGNFVPALSRFRENAESGV